MLGQKGTKASNVAGIFEMRCKIGGVSFPVTSERSHSRWWADYFGEEPCSCVIRGAELALHSALDLV